MPAFRSPTPSDRQGFDRRWYAPNLAKVYTPTSAADVVEAWSDIIASGAGGPDSTQITCGRHCYENFVYRDATKAIIDMTGLKGFGDDPVHGLYVDVGLGNWDMYRLLNNIYNRTLPAGSCYSVGLGGHITGGGYGILSRQWGLTVDHLTAVDIVVKRGPKPELITATETDCPDLFWALRGGGGGNFGIITRYYFGDPPVSPTQMYTSAYTLDWKDSTGKVMPRQTFLDLLAAYSEVCAQGQGGADASFDIFHLNHLAAGSLTWAVYLFDAPSHSKTGPDYEAAVEAAFAEKRRKLSEIIAISDTPGPINGHPWHGTARSLMPVGDTAQFRSYTFLEGVQNANGSGPNQYGKYKSAYMNKAFTADMGNALYDGLQYVPKGLDPSDMATSLCQVDSYGCAINQIAPDATPIPQRSAIMKLQYQTYWDNDCAVGQNDPVQAAAHLDWIRRLYSDVYAPYGGFPDPRRDQGGVVDGCYYNYCDNDLGTNDAAQPGIDNAMYLYFKDNFQTNPRNLSQIKTTWNPENWFNGPQSIPLAPC